MSLWDKRRELGYHSPTIRNRNNRMLLVRLSPSSTLSTVAAIYLAVLVFVLVVSGQERITGLNWHTDGERVFVQGEAGVSAFPNPVAVNALIFPETRWALVPNDVIPEPDVLPRFSETDALFTRQGQLADLLKAQSVVLEMADGANYSVTIYSKTLRDVPMAFWLVVIAGFLGLLVTAGVWSYKPHLTSARIFLLSGFGFALLTITLAYYSTRELAIADSAFRIAHAGNRLGMVFLTFGGSALLWHYPTQLGRFPFGRVVMSVGLVGWMNETFQWLDTPFHSYFDLFVFCTSASFINGLLQWRRSKNQPLERAALRWLLLSFLISFTAIWLLYVIPILITHTLQLDLVVAVWIVLCVFLGIALGISRYRIFDLDRWWLSVWLWFINGLLIFAIDVVLITVLDFGFVSSLTLTILIVGWLYFPLRQRVLKRFMGRQAQGLNDLLPRILGFMLSPHDPQDARLFWESLVSDATKPIHVEPLSEAIAEFEVQDDGMVLRVPAVDDGPGLELAGCDGGRRLFNKRDIDLLKQCHDLVCFGEAQYRNREEATNRERERIMRDLHDDVGAKLLTLIHRVPETYADMARSALTTLRETIFSLSVDNERPLDEFMSSMREEYVERCEAADCTLHWDVPSYGSRTVPAHVQINLSRVMRECLTNSLRHAEPGELWVSMQLSESSELTMDIQHNGHSKPVDEWQHGNGVLNMIRRMNELAGRLHFNDRQPSGSQVSLQFPIPQ